jgi:1-acyl-sn-glycerol-3-phosphate acyltransferase
VIPPGTASAPPRTVVRWLCRLLLRTVGVRSRLQGSFPPTGALLIANHFGWIEILAVFGHVDCTFIAKREVAHWPIVGWIARRCGVIFVDRARKRDLLRSIPAVTELLRQGRRVLLFPEGTTGEGRELLPFKSALVEAAVQGQVPVVPVAITASAKGADVQALCWVGGETLLDNLPRLLALSGAAITLTVGTPLPVQGCRKRLTHLARLAILTLVDWPAVRGRGIRQGRAGVVRRAERAGEA